MKTLHDGQLEIDHERGVIYFHLTNPLEIQALGVVTVLRICGLPTPIPAIFERGLDITHMLGCDWRKTQ